MNPNPSAEQDAASAQSNIPSAEEQGAEDKKSGDNSVLNQGAITPQMRKAMQSKLLAANFGNIVTVMMQTPQYKDTPLSKLRDVIVPAVLADQAMIAEAYDKQSGYTVPAGFALWARVSDEVDQRLSQDPSKDIELQADEWRSGDNFWIIEFIGEKRFVRQMLTKLDQNVFKGQPVKFRAIDKDGTRSIELLKRGNEKPDAETSEPSPNNGAAH